MQDNYQIKNIKYIYIVLTLAGRKQVAPCSGRQTLDSLAPIQPVASGAVMRAHRAADVFRNPSAGT